MAYFMEAWSIGAKRNAIPTCCRHSDNRSGWVSRLMPISLSRSALPHFDETARFPCLATVIPAPAATKADMVDILKVCAPSPPVPTTSRTMGVPASICVAFSRMILVKEDISSTVSPLSLMATINAPIWASVASPLMMASMAAVASVRVRSFPSTAFLIASLIIDILFPGYVVPSDITM